MHSSRSFRDAVSEWWLPGLCIAGLIAIGWYVYAIGQDNFPAGQAVELRPQGLLFMPDAVANNRPYLSRDGRAWADVISPTRLKEGAGAADVLPTRGQLHDVQTTIDNWAYVYRLGLCGDRAQVILAVAIPLKDGGYLRMAAAGDTPEAAKNRLLEELTWRLPKSHEFDLKFLY